MMPAKIFFHNNIRFLRERLKMSQEEVSAELDLSRNKLQALESGKTINPSVLDFIKFSDFFKVSVDSLLKVDLTKLGELKLKELLAGNDVYVSGGKIRVLSISVDKNDKENIEFVPKKARAGYLTGYTDPDFIAQLPKFALPHLPQNKTYRMFPTEGDSMLPIPENCLVIAEYVADWTSLKNTPGIIIMKSEQTFLFKVATLVDSGQHLLLHSLNPEYKDRQVWVGDVLEVWKYHSHITDMIPAEEGIMTQILSYVKEIRFEVNNLKKK